MVLRQTSVATDSRISAELTIDALGSLPTAGDEVTLPELRTLLLLATEGPQEVQALANVLLLDELATANLSASLVTRGFVVRIPSNCGSIVVALSTGGRRRVDDLIRHQALAVERLPTTQVVQTMPRSKTQEEP